jgi:tyrosyl-DNA phosphodiesterase-1
MTQAVWWQDVPWAAGGAGPPTRWAATLAAYIPRLGFPPPLHAALLAMVARADFSSMRTEVVAAVPGSHARLAAWGHGALAATLARARDHHPSLVGAPIVAQSSSMGVLKADQVACYVRAMSQGGAEDGADLGPPTTPSPSLRLALVWPTVDQVRNSAAGWASGGSIPGFPAALAAAEVRARLCSWGGPGAGGGHAGRANAMPHMKSYARYTDQGRIGWFVVGSANFSASAWGLPTPFPPKPATKQYNRSFELSVVLTPGAEAGYRAHADYGFCAAPLPSSWSLVGAPPPPPPAASPPTVRFWTATSAPAEDGGCDVVALPVPYALPPARYGPGDLPWTLEPHPGLDAFGRTVHQALGGE